MHAKRFTSSRPGIEGYPPCVRGWFRLAGAGRMRRGFRDVGYLLARRLPRFRPRGLGRPAWCFHRETLRRGLETQDERLALEWFATTYPGLAALLPADARREFVAGLRERYGDGPGPADADSP